jgi:hypothetical protein
MDTGTDLPAGWGFSLKINGRPDSVDRAIDASLSNPASPETPGMKIIDVKLTAFNRPRLSGAVAAGDA